MALHRGTALSRALQAAHLNESVEVRDIVGDAETSHHGASFARLLW